MAGRNRGHYQATHRQAHCCYVNATGVALIEKSIVWNEPLDDVHAVVTFNSIAGTEAILAGVPVFALAPSNAARPVSNTDLTK
jgi:hypothetical protein